MRRINIPENELRRLYEKEKMTTYQIADIFNCCQGTIWKRIHQFDIKPRKPWELFAKIPPKDLLEELYIKKGLSNWEISRQYGYHRSTVYTKLKEFGIKVKSPAESHIIHNRKEFNGNLEEKSYLIGFSIGDLRVRKKGETISVECGTTKKEQIDLILNLFKKYGHVWISKPNKKGAINIGANLDLSFEFLLEKKIPDWLLNNKKYFFSFLAGFTDAEGSFGVYDGQAIYQLGNYNKELLHLINQELTEYRIPNRKLCNDNTKGYIDKYGYKRKQDYWRLVIGRKFYLLKLFDSIEPYLKHEKKIRDLKISKKNILDRNRKFGDIMMHPVWRKNDHK